MIKVIKVITGGNVKFTHSVLHAETLSTRKYRVHELCLLRLDDAELDAFSWEGEKGFEKDAKGRCVSRGCLTAQLWLHLLVDMVAAPRAVACTNAGRCVLVVRTRKYRTIC